MKLKRSIQRLDVAHLGKLEDHMTLNPRGLDGFGVIALHDEVLAGISDDSVVLVDTLPAEFYRGEMNIYPRAGHITGALNIDGLGLLDNRGHLLPQQELEAMHDFDRNARVITYCGGGIVASTDAFVLTRLGFNNVAVYIASLEEWTTDPDNPMETSERK